MVGHGNKYERKKEAAIAALLTQRNIEEAAKVTGIGTNTLLRWMKDQGFQAAYREARRAAFSQSFPPSRGVPVRDESPTTSDNPRLLSEAHARRQGWPRRTTS